MTKRIYRTIYVGNLPGDIREREVEDLFYKVGLHDFKPFLDLVCGGVGKNELHTGDAVEETQFGPIVDIDLKVPPRPPGYAFVEFEDERDAEDAVLDRNGYEFDGHRLRVEFAHGGRGYSSSDRYSSHSSSSYRGGAPKHTDYRVFVTGLPSSASWQDLKDHMRRAGEVCFSDVYKDRRYGGMVGVVDYAYYDDMRRAVRKLDDSEFRNAFSRAYIRVREYSRSPSPYYRSRSRSYSRDRSYSRSRSQSRSYSSSPRRTARRSYSSSSRSRSRSLSDSRSRSLSRSRSPVRCSVSRSASQSHSPVARSNRSHSSNSEEQY